MNVLFLKGTQAEYDAATKSAYTFYYTEDTHRLYLGEILLASQTAAIGHINAAFTGKEATITSSYTPAGTISTIEQTPTGSIEVSVEEATEGQAANYTPAGEIDKPGISVDLDTVTIGSIVSAGELPSATLDEGTLPSATLNPGKLPTLNFAPGSFPEYSFNAGALPELKVTEGTGGELVLEYVDGELASFETTSEGVAPSVTWDAGELSSLEFNAGALPHLTFNKGLLPSIEEKVVVQGVAATLEQAPKFTGSPVLIRGGFAGNKFTITPVFTGTAGTATATYTPEGTVSAEIVED